MSSMGAHTQSRSYLIVGQGIAGSMLAWHLMKVGHAVQIVDQNHHESSTMVSAGLVNPVTGQRLAVTPQFDTLYAQAIDTYAQIGDELKESFLVPKPIIRVIRSAEELAKAHQIQASPTSSHFIGSINKSGHFGSALNDPLGTISITHGGYLKTQLFLKTLKKCFTDNNALIEERFNYDDLIVTGDHVEWKLKRFDAVIFCEGFKAKWNPWFKDLPYNLTKGEILRVKFDQPLPDGIICKQQWCLPTEDGTYLAGATYDRENLNTLSTPEGETIILQGLSDFIHSKVRVIERYAGVRPVMIDTKPVIALHPTTPRVGIFNGFGSKGILWTPYYAKVFAEQL